MTCVICDDVVEEKMYLFFGCAHFRDCCVVANLWSKIEQKLLSFLALFELFLLISARLYDIEKSHFAALLYSIWHARN